MEDEVASVRSRTAGVMTALMRNGHSMPRATCRGYLRGVQRSERETEYVAFGSCPLCPESDGRPQNAIGRDGPCMDGARGARGI